MTKPVVRDPIYRRRRFDAEIIELCVRWYITYRLSYRDLVAMMAQRGIVVSHTTIQRTLLIHGARSAILAAQRKTEHKNVWLANLLDRRHPNIAAVALANKNARTVWAMLAHGREFKANYVPTRLAA